MNFTFPVPILTPEIEAAWEVPAFRVQEHAPRAREYCVVIPVLNEGERIRALLARMKALGIPNHADILIIDGGSSDGSLEETGLRDFGVRTLLTKTGPGKLGGQLRCAYAYALRENYRGIVTIDGNNKDEPDAIPRFIEELERGTDFVQASRFVSGGVAENTPWVRDLAIRLIHAPLLSFASSFHWTDTTQGFRAYSRRLLLHPGIQPFRAEFARYELLAFLSYQAPRLGLVCKELPTTRRYPKEGKVPTKISAVHGNLDLVATLLKACFGGFNPPAPERPRRGRPWPGLPHILMGLVLALALARETWIVSNRFTVQSYSDTTIGSITWHDANKESDFRALSVLLLASLAIPCVLKILVHGAARGKREIAEELDDGMLWSLVPVAVMLAVRAWGFAQLPQLTIEWIPYLALPATAVALPGLLWLRRREMSREQARERVRGTLLVPLLALFAGLGLQVLVSRLGVGRPWLEALGKLSAPWVSMTGAAALALLGGLVCSSVKCIRKWLCALIFAVQLPLPLLFLSLHPPALIRAPGAPEFQSEVAPCLKWVLLACAVVAWGLWLRGAMRTRRDRAPLESWLVTACLAGIPCFLAARHLILPQFPLDRFHNGEELLPWDQFWNHGKLPFEAFNPIHPGADLLGGLARQLLFDGTAAALYDTGVLTLVLAATATFLAVRACMGKVRALMAALMIGPMLSQLAFLPTGLFVLGIPWIFKRPVRWLAVWIILCSLEVFYNPSVGVAFVMGTAPLALWQIWQAIKLEKLALRRLALACCIVVALVLAVPATRKISIGFFTFLFENQATNTIAHSEEFTFGSPGGYWGGYVSNTLAFELLRNAWVWVPLLMLILIGAGLFRRRRAGSPLIPLAIMTATTASMIGYWSFGRIDPGLMSRPGFTTIMLATQVLPALILLGSVVRPVTAILALSVLCGILNIEFGHIEGLADKASYRRTLPAGTLVVRGKDVGFPKLGTVVASPEQLADLQSVKAALDEFLKPGETYFDLTNYQSYYFYLNLPVPVLYPATFNAANTRIQRRVLAQLRANPPPVVLISPQERFDGSTTGLRSYLLYRECVLHYIPVRRGSWTLLVDPRRLPHPPGAAEQMSLLDGAFSQENLHKIPSAWGKSWSTLRERYTELAGVSPSAPGEARYVLTSAPGEARYVLTSAPGEARYVLKGADGAGIPGRDIDAVRLEFDFDALPGTEPQLEIAWESDRPGTVRFFCTHHRGTFIIPLGAEPRFLLSERVQAIRVRLLTSALCPRVNFGTLSPLKLKARD